MIKIHKSGQHIARSPLSYPALAPLFSSSIELVSDPRRADLYLFAHSLDIENAPRALVEDWRQRRRPIVLLSEEPFWDTIWGRQPLKKNLILQSQFGALPVIQLNHCTSDIFRFARIPYYLLTNHRFANAYAARFTRNAKLSAADWKMRFAARPVDLTFMFERRPEPYHAVRWPRCEIIGLCSWRTGLAEAANSGKVERLGQSWQGGQTRFEMRNWYLDKLTRLDDHTRLFAAFENTHQNDYITEKIFDAFACGARPLYFAGPRHRIHDFDLPGQSWANFHDLEVASALRRLQALQWDPEFFEAYAVAQQRLAMLMGDAGIWVAERQLLKTAIEAALSAVLDGVGIQSGSGGVNEFAQGVNP